MENKIHRFSERLITEGMRVNIKFLGMKGRYPITEVIQDLHSLSILLSRLLADDSGMDDFQKEVSETLLELRNWREQGFQVISCSGSEWIPVMK